MELSDKTLTEIVELADEVARQAYAIGRDFLAPASRVRGYQILPREVSGIRLMNSFGLTNEEIRPEEINSNHLEYLGGIAIHLIRQATKLQSELDSLKRQF